jgi:hypothetical protein
MRKIAGMLLVAGMVLAGVSPGLAQTPGPQAVVNHAVENGAAAAAPDTRTEKQKALAMQTELLFTMATELKAQVDLTNKNILSLKVVEKAEAIETLAKGMRGQAKK